MTWTSFSHCQLTKRRASKVCSPIIIILHNGFLRYLTSLLLSCLILGICKTAECSKVPSKANAQKFKIIPTQDLVYEGAFRVAIDQNAGSGKWYGYNSGFMTYNPYGNSGRGSILAVGQENSLSWVGEMSIPGNPSKGDISAMPRAKGLQPFTDVRGVLGSIQTGDLSQQTYGLAVIPPNDNQKSPRLYWLSIYNYNPANKAVPNHGGSIGSSDLNFSDLKETGQWNLRGRTPAQYGWYALTLPRKWADTYVNGQYLGVGRDRINSADGQGWGPSLYTSAPWTQGTSVANGSQLANTKLLGYTMSDPVSKNYSHGDGSRGATWATIGSKSAFIVAYNKAIRSASDSTLTVVGDYPFEDYKTGTQIGLPATEISTYQPSDTDYKAGPWFGTLLFYDTDELAKVAQGIKQPNEVKPYAMFNLESFLKRRQGKVPSKALPIGGVTFDATHNKLYVQELLVDGSYPIIHVFQLQDNGINLPSAP